jgi:hypothetical protein
VQFAWDANGEPMLIDPALVPPESFETELWPAGSFTYTAMDDKGAESEAATVTLYEEVRVLAEGQQIPEAGIGSDFTVETIGNLDATDLWLV